MSSENRSSSAVRNLRSLFENKNGDSGSGETRGRSPSGLAAGGEVDKDGARRTSKVRASFVSVEPTGGMATLQPSESNAGRRGSLGEADRDLDLKKTISQEPAGPETAVSSVAATPDLNPTGKQLGSTAGEKEADNPDKPVTGAEEEPKDMKPADPTSLHAVSGGQALPPVAEDLRKSTSQKTEAARGAGRKAAVNGTSKPAAISTKGPPKPASSVKSPASAKTPTSTTSASKAAKTEPPKAQPAKAPLKKQSRSSLTAPTAASMARSGTSEKTASSTTSKPKPRETTKPVSLPSHLTAPTASSRAKHEPEAQSKPATSSLRASTTSKPKTSALANKPSRASLAPEHRPGSRTSQTSHARRSVAPADGSFLDRMMKPTAASASKTHEKTEVKSPPRQKAAAPSKPKVNGTTAKTTGKKPLKTEMKGKSEGTSTAAPMPSEVPVEEPKEEAPAVEEPSPEVSTFESVDVSKISDTQAEAATESADVAENAVNTPSQDKTVSEPAAPSEEAAKILEPASGNETPQAAAETATGSAGLEATPAGLSGEETIR